MADSGRILMVDDEVLYLYSTADQLRGEGYLCDVATDKDTALELLKQNPYDLLISDINLPGNTNTNLELIEELARVSEGLPIILVTGYPSIESAIHAVQLPVVAYLVKPVGFNSLLTEIRKGIDRYQIYQSVRGARQRLQSWQQELNGLEHSMQMVPGNVSQAPVQAFLTLTMQNIAASLNDVRHLTEVLARASNDQYVCQLLNCPRARVLSEALVETIDVLKKTQAAFKSKELGVLRKKLETLLKEWGTA